MKRILSYIFVIAAMLTSCEIETSGNGKLDGYWKLCGIDTLSTGNKTDFTERSIFWAVQANILSAQNKEDLLNPKYMFRFRHTADSLIVYNPQIYDKAEGNKEVTQIDELRIFGINSLTSRFHVESLSHKKLTLSDEYLRLHFRKF
ncbi:MAG: lipocalin-like domain-containing protein [Bacteroidaceae bacterium]|nr:lipocalin-like domain-containing protein [Bacteroidaceae bacterium]